jgi:hypothetical protein
MNAPSVTQHCADEAIDILKRAKLPLIGKPQTAARIEVSYGRAINPLNPVKASPSRSRYLTLEHLLWAVRWYEEKAVDTFEVAFDLLFANDFLDPVNRRCMTLSGEPRTSFPKDAFEFAVAVIEGI